MGHFDKPQIGRKLHTYELRFQKLLGMDYKHLTDVIEISYDGILGVSSE